MKKLLFLITTLFCYITGFLLSYDHLTTGLIFILLGIFCLCLYIIKYVDEGGGNATHRK